VSPHRPRLAIWLLTKRLSAEWCEFVIGDLEEEFAMRSVDSRIAAHAWFWWQAVRDAAGGVGGYGRRHGSGSPLATS
jgi:hypothetical protein